MKNFLYVLSERTNAVIRVIAMTCVIVMLGTMLLQIFARYGFNAPPVWTEEVARYMMVWSGLDYWVRRCHLRAVLMRS